MLDEPNSNLDDAGERDLARAMSELKRRNITVLVITHRMSVVGVVDKIMVLTDGQMRDFDERAKVLEAMNQASKPSPVPVRKVIRKSSQGPAQ